jgi:DNA-directed RNA polymerase specialized sigma24 family protein
LEEALETERESLVDHDGYELFRQAIMNGDEDAWAKSIARYRPQLIAWAAYCNSKTDISENNEDIADQAFARAWKAITPKCFAQFETLAAVLAYLRLCVTTVAIDHGRTQKATLRAAHKLETPVVATPEQIVLDKMAHSELWRLVNQIIETEQERVVLFEMYLLDLPPRMILARHPEFFTNVKAIYNVKRNLLGRLQRSREIQELYCNWF